MKQQENMILNQLNQYRNLYLQACNENTRLKHAMIWMVRMYECYAPLAGCIEYEIGRFNVPGHDPMCSKHPDHIIGKNPLLPSFARFYFDMKIHYNVSENRILEMLKDMEAFMPQSSLNKWIHEIMTGLRERLLSLMIEVVKSSTYTNNDETRILVRNLLEDKPDKYKVEYIHAALSLEKKMVVMLYGEGSRSHTIPEEQIFEHSNIKYFTADRAKLYETVVKSMEEKSLYESCKMNNLNFGRYIEDILTRIKDGDKDYKSMLPCYYVEKTDEVKECA